MLKLESDIKPVEERKVVIVEPEIPENTGFIARLAENYGYSMRLVNPGFNLEDARKTASNAQQRLRDARIYETVEEAVEDLEHVAGTKPGKGIAVHEFEPGENTSIMIGRESSGLTNSELELCDAVVHIETPGYDSLNQSHATAIVMDRMKQAEKEVAPKKMRDELYSRFSSSMLKELVERSGPSRRELEALLGELDRPE